jgi:hypothetical protein
MKIRKKLNGRVEKGKKSVLTDHTRRYHHGALPHVRGEISPK